MKSITTPLYLCQSLISFLTFRTKEGHQTTKAKALPSRNKTPPQYTSPIKALPNLPPIRATQPSYGSSLASYGSPPRKEYMQLWNSRLYMVEIISIIWFFQEWRKLKGNREFGPWIFHYRTCAMKWRS